MPFVIFKTIFLSLCRQRSLEMERLAEQRHHEEEAWQHQQELLLQAEEQRLKMMDREEQRLADQRARCFII